MAPDNLWGGFSPPGPWRLLDLGSCNAPMNMAIDEAILGAVIRQEISSPTLRFYTWQPPAISIGCLQRVSELLFEQAKALGLDMVRRPTGGRIVLHKGDLTYSFIFDENSSHIPKGILPSYQIISQAIQRGLGLLEVVTNPCLDMEDKKDKRDVREKKDRRDKKTDKPAFCFSLAARYELLVHGKKMIGNAQKREKGGVLQHGSIMVEYNHGLINQLFPPWSNKSNNQGKQGEFISLSEVMKEPVSIDRLKEAIVKGFAETFFIDLTLGYLTEWEKREAKRLYDEKYSKEQWNKEGQKRKTPVS